jgi:archaemetzincin
MSGTNGLEETDRRRTAVCPECLAKIVWAMNYAPQMRATRLAEFLRAQNLTDEAAFLAQEAGALRRVEQ